MKLKKYKSIPIKLMMFAVLVFIASLSSCTTTPANHTDDEITSDNPSESSDNTENINEDSAFNFDNDYFPKFNNIETLYVIESGALSDTERVTIQTLQGILAQKGSTKQIYISFGGSYTTWLNQLKNDYNISIVNKSNPWTLTEELKEYITDQGFVLFRTGTSTVNAACTVAGQTGYLAVERGSIKKAEAIGLELKIDASEDYPTDESVFDSFENTLSQKYLFQQNYNNLSLRDIGVAYGAYYFYDSSVANKITSHVFPNSPLFGWHNDEVTGVNEMSAKSVVTIASDHALNLTVFSSLPRKIFQQPETKKNAVGDLNVHYVTFMLSDGDNLQWYLNGALLDNNQFRHKAKGTIPMGWTCPPTISDLAPNILEWGYGKKTENDSFIAAVSGFGYIYPSRYKLDDLEDFADKTAYYMKKSGLEYMQILDDPEPNPSLKKLDFFTAHEQIKGIFYMTGDKYRMGKGKIIWSNDKPVVCARESLWSGEGASREKRDQTMYEMAVRLNTYPKDATTIDGYTAVNVHAWSHNYDDIIKMREFINTLPDGDKVVFVTPDEFMELISENVEHTDANPKLDFASSKSNFDYSVIP